jgi:MFS family permease
VLLGTALGGGALWALAVPRLELRAGRRALFTLSALALAVGGLLLWLEMSNVGAVITALLLGGVVTGSADVSPLAALEQASLAGTVEDRDRTSVYAAYNLLGYIGAAVGALAAAPVSSLAGNGSLGFVGPSHDATLLLYSLLGLALLPAYVGLSQPIDQGQRKGTLSPLSGPSRPIVYSLSALFAVDAFGGGLILNSLLVYYFSTRFHPPVGALGLLFFGANITAGLSLLLAVPLARRIGLVNTMVFTHLPSNVFTILLVVAPSYSVAAALWIARSTLSQMDVPTRQSYTQAIVPNEDRAAAAGYTTAARSVQALGAPVTGAFLAAGGPWISAPFAVAGTVKIAYDLAILRRFRGLRPPEEGHKAS